jgi:hypothetical protein
LTSQGEVRRAGGIVSTILGKLTGGQFDPQGLLASAVDGPSADHLQLWPSSSHTLQKQVETARQ